MKHSTTRKLTALAAGMSLAFIAGSASAFNLGEVWVGDQFNGKVYIADQSDLNNPFLIGDAASDKVTTIDLLDQGGHASTRMHIIGFSNHAGLDPASRAVFGYLDGVAEIWKTNGGTHAPEKIADLQVLGGSVGGKSSLHMCGPSPDNSMIACSSIGGRKVIIFSADMENDMYTRLGDWDLNPADMPLSPRLKGKAKSTVKKQMAIINEGSPNPGAICNNFDTTSKTLYYTVQVNSASGGVVVLDVNDPSNPTIVDAWATPNADGCGLVNSQDGNYMWINHGHNTASDIEKVTKWDNNNYISGDVKTVGPVGETLLPRASAEPNGRNGDVHGAQFAGIGGPFLWEVMRIDDLIHVVDPNSVEVVNTIDLSAQMGIDAPQPDVLDRSALGTKMYFSTRGFIPTTAITGFVDLDRDPGIVTMKTLFGYNGQFMKTTKILTGITKWLCDDHDNDGSEDHDHATQVCPPALQNPPAGTMVGDSAFCDIPDSNPDDEVDDSCHFDGEYLGEVDTVDPHGLKSLQYLTGGF